VTERPDPSWSSGARDSESRRKFRPELELRMQPAGTVDQCVFGFGNVRIGHAAVHRAYCGAFLVVKKSHAFGTSVGRNIIDVLGQRRALRALKFGELAAFVNRVVRTSRQARPTIDTFFRNDGSHFYQSAARSLLGLETPRQLPSASLTLPYRLPGLPMRNDSILRHH
jgi:hypothetical protein